MTERTSTRVVEFRISPWLQAYELWLEKHGEKAYEDLCQMDVLDAFRAGYDAGAKGAVNA